MKIKIPVNLSLIMDNLQFLFTIFAIMLFVALLLVKIKKNNKLNKPVIETGRDKGELVLRKYITKLCKPVMETGGDKGELVLGNYDMTR